jgi:hypothetical protein
MSDRSDPCLPRRASFGGVALQCPQFNALRLRRLFVLCTTLVTMAFMRIIDLATTADAAHAVGVSDAEFWSPESNFFQPMAFKPRRPAYAEIFLCVRQFTLFLLFPVLNVRIQALGQLAL